jgi:hypothetical protein
MRRIIIKADYFNLLEPTMKQAALLAFSLCLTSVAHAGCDLALLEMRNDLGPISYNQEVFSAFWKQGYDAVSVKPFTVASNFSYVAEVKVECAPYLMNPFLNSTITTVKLFDGQTRALVGEAESLAQLAVGSCKVDLEGPIAKLPACRK